MMDYSKKYILAAQEIPTFMLIVEFANKDGCLGWKWSDHGDWYFLGKKQWESSQCRRWINGEFREASPLLLALYGLND